MGHPPPLQPFDYGKETIITRQQLPHWVQEGVTYFVTFRLADSLPAPMRARWEEDRALWLRAQGLEPDKEGLWRRAFGKKGRDMG